MEFDLESPLTNSVNDDEQQHQHHWDPMAALFAAESDHMVSPACAIDLSVRREAVSILLQAQSDCDLDPFVVYLAINYVHRFLFKSTVSMEKPWILRLLAVACLSLASKMKKVTDFSVADLQQAEGLVFDARTIRRMELLVLGALDWRMRSITPFSFLRYFASSFSPAQPPLLFALKSHATQTIFKTQNDAKIMEFKPSIVAAAALFSAAYELFPVQFPAFRSSVSSCKFLNEVPYSSTFLLNSFPPSWTFLGSRCFDILSVRVSSLCSSAQEELWECYSLMEGWDTSPEKASSCDTPVTVLATHHRHWPSSESERTSVGSKLDDRDLKKRRISTFHACDCDT